MGLPARRDEQMTKPARRRPPKTKTVGFGCPVPEGVLTPHRFVVTIPRSSTAPVEIVEDRGVGNREGEGPEEIARVRLERSIWRAIANDVKHAFNQRLKINALPAGTWKVGENFVDRLLGKELLVLAWAVESAPPEKVPVAVRNWLALRPEERWWLYGMTESLTGGLDDTDKGWRMALRYALAESPDGAAIVPRRPKTKTAGAQLSLLQD